MSLRLHDRVRLLEPVAGVPAGAEGWIVIEFPDHHAFQVELADPALAPATAGLLDIDEALLEIAA